MKIIPLLAYAILRSVCFSPEHFGCLFFYSASLGFFVASIQGFFILCLEATSPKTNKAFPVKAMGGAKLGDWREGEGWGRSLLTSFRCSCLEIDKEMAAWLLVSKGMQMSQGTYLSCVLLKLGAIFTRLRSNCQITTFYMWQ